MIFKYRGIKYEISYKGEGIQDTAWFIDQLEYAASVSDYVTVENRLKGGIIEGFIKKNG